MSDKSMTMNVTQGFAEALRLMTLVKLPVTRLVGIGLVLAAQQMAVIVFSRIALSIIGSRSVRSEGLVLAGLLASTILSFVIVGWARTYYAKRLGTSLRRGLTAMLGTLLREPSDPCTQRETADLAIRSAMRLLGLPDLVAGVLIASSTTLVMMLFSIVYLVWSGAYTVAAFATALGMALAGVVLHDHAARASLSHVHDSQQDQLVTQCFRTKERLPSIRAFAAEAVVLRSLGRVVNAWGRTKEKLVSLRFRRDVAVDSLAAIMRIVLIVLWFASVSELSANSTVGLIVGMTLMGGISSLANSATSLAGHAEHIRIMRRLAERRVPRNGTVPVESPSVMCSAPDIVFDNVVLDIGGKRILDGISFNVGSGERVALVGRSGNGKSSILRLLLGLERPTSGRIIVSGRELDSALARELRKSAAVMLQDALLLTDSPMNELRLAARTRLLEGDVREVLTSVGLDGRLSERLEDPICESDLSGGELQRLSFARTLVRKSSLLVLDEPSANLDAVSENLIMALVAADNRTALIVAHSLAVIESVHRVVVIEHGRVTEQGTVPVILTSGSRFRRVFG